MNPFLTLKLIIDRKIHFNIENQWKSDDILENFRLISKDCLILSKLEFLEKSCKSRESLNERISLLLNGNKILYKIEIAPEGASGVRIEIPGNDAENRLYLVEIQEKNSIRISAVRAGKERPLLLKIFAGSEQIWI